MANTTADKLAKLEATKAALKTSINGSGNIVGDVFADYSGAVDDFRSKVANAITEKGVATAATDTPDQMAANIGAIKSGGISDTFVNVELRAGTPDGAEFYHLTKDSEGNLIGEITNIPLPVSKNIQVPIGSFLYVKSWSNEVHSVGGEILVNGSPLNAVLITENTTKINAY